jgi:hypothetical protein
MGRFDKLVNILIVILILVYTSKYALEHIQADFFIKYPELNPVNT